MSNLFSTEGCIKRSEWWGTTIITSIITSLVISFGTIIATIALEAGSLALFVIAIIMIPAMTPAIYIIVCAHVKRLHDRNKSGYLAFLCLVPIASLWVFVQCGFLPSVENSEYNE